MAALVKIWVPDPERFDAVNVGGIVQRARGGPGRGRPARLHVLVHGPRPLGRGRLDAERLHPGPPYRNRLRAHQGRGGRRGAGGGGRRARTSSPLYPGVIYGPGEMTDGNIVGADGRRPPERPAVTLTFKLVLLLLKFSLY